MVTEDYCIIYNPISGNAKSLNILDKFTEDLKKINKSYKIIKTEYPGHAKKIASHIIGYKKLIAIGGDGTFHDIINGLMINKQILPTVGFLPGGTGNSLMHDLSATSYREAFELIINKRIKKLDILKLDYLKKTIYSFNVVGWGLATDIAILAEKMRLLGKHRYTIASIYYIFQKKSRLAKIIIDGVARSGSFLFILNLNTIHTGTAMKAAPKALFDDGLFDIIILNQDISRFNLLILLPKIFSGNHVQSKYVEYIQAKSISIIPKVQGQLNIDGEVKCYTPIKISIIPNRINIFC